MADIAPTTLGTPEEYEASYNQLGKSVLHVLKLLLLGQPPDAPGGPVFGLAELLGPAAPALRYAAPKIGAALSRSSKLFHAEFGGVPRGFLGYTRWPGSVAKTAAAARGARIPDATLHFREGQVTPLTATHEGLHALIPSSGQPPGAIVARMFETPGMREYYNAIRRYNNLNHEEALSDTFIEWMAHNSIRGGGLARPEGSVGHGSVGGPGGTSLRYSSPASPRSMGRGSAAFISPETKAHRAKLAEAYAAGEINMPPPTGPDPSPKVAGMLDELDALIRGMYQGKRFPSQELYPKEVAAGYARRGQAIEDAAQNLASRLAQDPRTSQRPGFDEAIRRLRSLTGASLGSEQRIVENRLQAAVQSVFHRLYPRQGRGPDFNVPSSVYRTDLGSSLAFPTINSQPIISMKSGVYRPPEVTEDAFNALLQDLHARGLWP